MTIGSHHLKPDALAPVRVHMRWMQGRDAEEVCAIEHASFGPTALSAHALSRLLKPRNVIGHVAECWDTHTFSDRVVGYMAYTLWRSRIVLLRLAVAPDLRRRAVATQMLGSLKRKLDRERPVLTTLVPDDNLGAQLLLRAAGLQAVRVHRRDGGADQYQFELRLAAQEVGPRRA
jgi:ribosomal protein S18 acetylase RimI-like enzyme